MIVRLGQVERFVLSADLEVPMAPAHRPVVLNHSRFFKAEHVLELHPGGDRSVQIAAIPGRDQPSIQVWKERVVQMMVRSPGCGYLQQPHRLDQPVLKHPVALAPPTRLRRVRGDHVDCQNLHGSIELV